MPAQQAKGISEQAPAHHQEADRAFAVQEYLRAAKLYERAAAGGKVDHDIAHKLAICYEQLNDYPKAAKWYGWITYHEPLNGEAWVHYGDVLKSLGKYKEAKLAYGRAPDSLYATIVNRVQGCDSAMAWMQSPTTYKVVNLAGINTAYSDWGAVWKYPHSIVFTSDSLRRSALDRASRSAGPDSRTGHSFQKVYIADSSSHGLGSIKGFAPAVNFNIYHDGPVVFSHSGDTAWFTVTNPDKLDDGSRVAYKIGNRTLHIGYRRLEIMFTVRDASGKWSMPLPFIQNNTTHYSVAHPALSPDGRFLYFTSDMPGGYGKMDIWYVRRGADGSWSTPVNCGPVVNTADEESFPTMGDDGVLYFASKGHVGMGGYDIYKAVGQGNSWQPVENLKYPINSSADDFYFTTKDTVSGFLSSNRPGGKGSDDIYAYVLGPMAGAGPLPFRVIVLKTEVLDKLTGKAVADARVVVTHRQKGLRWTTYTGKDGSLYQVLEPDEEYGDTVEKSGYAVASQVISTKGIHNSDTLRVRLYLGRNPVTGEVIYIENLYYDFDKSAIRPDAALVLNRLAAYLKKFPTMTVDLSSHTDSRGSDGYNLALSDRRARSAENYLIRRGISPDRMTLHGYGESRPVNRCVDGVPCSASEYQANRRTEVRVVRH